MSQIQESYKDRDIPSPIGGNIMQCKVSSLVSNIIGNATEIMISYIKSLFPKNFFKTTYVDQTLGTFNLEENDLIRERQKPILVVSPKLKFTDDTQLTYNPEWTTTSVFTYVNFDQYYSGILKDEKTGIKLYAVPDRICVDFDFIIITPTKMSQVNTAFHLKHSMAQKDYIKFRPIMEAEIPKYIIYAIAQVLNIDMNNDEQKNRLVYYLNNQSHFDITRKKNLASSLEMYDYAYRTTVISNNQDFPEIDDGDEEGQTKDNFRINFTLNSEFWAPITFILETKKKVNQDLIDDSLIPINGLTENELVSIHHTIRFAPVKDYNDMKLYVWEAYITDYDVEVDELDFSYCLPLELRMYCDILTNESIKANEDLTKGRLFIKLFRDSMEVPETQYSYTWDTKKIKLNNPLYGYTYHFAIYVQLNEFKRIMEKYSKNYKREEVNK